MGWPRMANHTSSTTSAMPSSALSGCWPRKISGAPDTRPCSLAKATIEPVKVMAPIIVPSPISIRLCILILPGAPMPKASGDTKAAAATNTAARPTSEWNAATSCGSAVIWMRSATTRADRAADDEAADDQPGRDHARRGDGDADRDHHADDAEQVALRATSRAS